MTTTRSTSSSTTASRRLPVALATAALTAGVAAPAFADDAAVADAFAIVAHAERAAAGVAHFEAGRLLEASTQLALARTAYAASVEADPAGRWARRAQIRVDSLAPAEDAATAAVMAEFAALLANYSPENADQTWVAVNALTRRAPDPVVRAELDEWIAREALHVRRDYETAWQTWARAAREPSTPADRVLGAIDGMVASATLAGRLDETRVVIAEVLSRRTDLPPLDATKLGDEVTDQQMRFVFDRIAWATLLVFGLVVVASRPWRTLRNRQTWRSFPWRSMLFIAWLFAFAGFLAENWHDETGLDALSAVGVAWACHLGAWLVGVGRFESRLARVFATVSVAVGSFSAIYAWFRFVGQESFLGF